MRAIFAIIIFGALALGIVPPHRVQAQGSPNGPAAEGKRVFQRANCVGCHKWHGAGGGGYGGDALSLRATQLDRDQIMMTVACGRPSTGMPYFQRGAYDGEDHPCYGMGRQDLDKDIPVEATIFLRPNEVAVVADYVVAEVKGKGEPNYAECTAFFGEGSRVCNVYKDPSKNDPSKSGPTAAGAQPGKQGG